MEHIKTIIELLAEIDFSFWQIFFFLVIMLFRKQIMAIFNRIVTIKSPVGEINFSQNESKVVEEIKNIQDKVSSLPDGIEEKSKITEGLYSLTRELLLDSLDKIRANTTYLWPNLESAYERKQTRIKTEIRRTTLNKIRNELELLKHNGLLIYSYRYIDEVQNDSVLQIVIEMDTKLFELIKLLQERSWYKNSWNMSE